MDDSMARDDSMFSHEERAIAEHLRDGATTEEIAAERNQDEAAVEAAIDRIEEKTLSALATLEQSPFLKAAIEDLDDSSRENLHERLDMLLSGE